MSTHSMTMCPGLYSSLVCHQVRRDITRDFNRPFCSLPRFACRRVIHQKLFRISSIILLVRHAHFFGESSPSFPSSSSSTAVEKSAHSEHVCEGWQSRMSYPFQLQQQKAVVLEQQTYCTGRNAVLLISYCLEMIEIISTLKEVIVGKV